ncbi:hypothetical protein BC938DRAFT_482975 [Jimgerdemannia flammicorona]|uniref:G-protein coupled receptors family 2 profile 2 domain-containing protein n=1 Tax=Jimgerdemannia flammicorona TaxID=994334 RepID=A0A433QCV0_9FUNG|nr:hypothetical protein BC938DRAFT_482975 [Jimgerdemannia flammicorona]
MPSRPQALSPNSPRHGLSDVLTPFPSSLPEPTPSHINPHLSELMAPVPIPVEPGCVWNAYFTAWLQLVNMFFYVFLAVNLWWAVNRASSGTDADKQFFWYYMGFGFGIPVVMVVTLYLIEEDAASGWYDVTWC